MQEATEQRKEENAEYKELMAGNGAAKELILFAKNRMNKFYNPSTPLAASQLALFETQDSCFGILLFGDTARNYGFGILLFGNTTRNTGLSQQPNLCYRS